ncbi:MULTISPECIES: hypothetical protein [Methylobacterium]|uniref:Uncharacterized protein n=1 Tax=Methylobacterium jeotgali TaxID=381630 RepID=A0ABQ4STW3_9HYPH|nr:MULTISPECIES: hypothetical protein [Methylobacterium]PIU05727.1 MAG: hypothetical protein COT56_13205 [Methylobacterium sp. CG09_land_8_20_14_0_10_71_15]PIU15268.1 MAG: hypothetical protein COT28_04915 [Methylobacterium sp. CG08_land_8_20_14_0_20_71_15]GBU19797.1 hypothetical protein AwMethylo_40120 [Methylobacterium sp.]GJE06532.1 hypothetical protein AOPFMNJM_1852 [Methylobacterium jeotgali]
MQYVTVFDASTAGSERVVPFLLGVGLMLLGAYLWFRPDTLVRLGLPKPLAHRSVVPALPLVFGLHTLVTLGARWSATDEAGEAVLGNRCATVEGRVARFHPMPYGGHDRERFEVNGVPFSYSDYIVTGGFNTSASHGGPIREGLPVRICHVDGLIVRLEVGS